MATALARLLGLAVVACRPSAVFVDAVPGAVVALADVQNATAIPKAAALTFLRASASTRGPLLDMLRPSGRLVPPSQPGQWTPRATWPLEPLFKVKRWHRKGLNLGHSIDKPTWMKDTQGEWQFRPPGHGEQDPSDMPNEIDDVEDKAHEAANEEIEEAEDEFRTQKRKWMGMFCTRSFFDWALFFCFSLFFLCFYYTYMIGLPTKTRFHGLAVLAWISVAMLYNIMLTLRFGVDDGILWFNGYLMEFIFSLENVFVFHIIVESFATPTVCAQKILFMMVCCQVLFEMLLYMGLADVIDSMNILPYILGAWLTYLGVHAALESDDHDEEFDIHETRGVRWITWCLGDRLSLEYEDNSNLFVYRDGKSRMTMLGLVFICMLTADVLLEVDVTVTKMEASNDEYMSFTSSALAGFAVPELFFVARDLFRRFGLLKYGISFVLIFYGLQLLFPGCVELSAMQGCGIICLVMLICILLSAGWETPHSPPTTPHLKSSLSQHSVSSKEVEDGQDANDLSAVPGDKFDAEDGGGGARSLRSLHGGYGSTKTAAESFPN